ncbi:hypothetical protein GCM10008967_42860 [Bacillus carboniphilus]|uniref:Uncharacterized protein n=1 Tax=Bacillus carboniphilus TaxID=86663 RepID=A0ABP3GNR9_9BACI
MRTISSEEILNQLGDIERELEKLEEIFAVSFEEREKEFIQETNQRLHHIDLEINRINHRYIEMERNNSRKSKSTRRKLELDPQFQV